MGTAGSRTWQNAGPATSDHAGGERAADIVTPLYRSASWYARTTAATSTVARLGGEAQVTAGSNVP